MTPTPAQRKILDAIAKLTRKQQEPPTLQEVADRLKITHQRVAQQVRKLRDGGILRKAQPNEQRSLELTASARDILERT